jgi:phenylpropionate dioxygenase-like ring-hydroxylating dioxygenase large terminal subunit
MSIAPDQLQAIDDAVSDTGSSLPAWIYRNTEFLELERQHLFMPAWHLVCHQNDIPEKGDYQTFRMLGEIAFVLRGKDGRINAFHNVCRHRAARLLDDGKGNCGGMVTCPYHAWSYALDGRLRGVPMRREYENLDPEAHSLVPVECELHLGFVFIRFVPGTTTLTQLLAPAMDELGLYRLDELTPIGGGKISERAVAVNWKQGTDNYVDALHVRAAHPGLDSLLGESYTLGDLGSGVSRLSGQVEHLVGAGPSVRAYQSVLPDVAHLPDSHKRLWLYFMFWPNMAFNIYPDCFEFMQFIPVDATHCIVREGVYGHRDTRRAMRLARYLNLRINRQVGKEDRELIARVQDGMNSSSFSAGPFGRNERCLRSFATRLRRAIPVATLTREPAPASVAATNRAMSAGG